MRRPTPCRRGGQSIPEGTTAAHERLARVAIQGRSVMLAELEALSAGQNG